MNELLNDDQLIERILDHIDNKTTDMGTEVRREPTASYLGQDRFDAEVALIRRSPVPFCPTAMLSDKGSYVARTSAGTPILVVRGMDDEIRAFINGCRHRGMPVASGTGCARAFVCPYHAWSYALDGSLKNIAGSHGFPDVDTAEHGLIQISAQEKGGLIYINQETEITESDLAGLPTFFSPNQECFEQESVVDNTNWKLIAETTMEGYHIKGLHKNSFYPYGLDNTNVVETFGPNSRVVFPFKRINDLRQIEPSKRNLDGLITTVHNLFPNTVVSILSKHSTLTIFEPIAPNRTEILIYRVTNQLSDGSTASVEDAKYDADFVKGAGFDEDREAAVKIQETINAGRNTHLTFGLFEKAIVHFHQSLEGQLRK
jgi:phenylpropionate dioxygenase-like ring-hydroxylating dioxygenase large terminal subunit